MQETLRIYDSLIFKAQSIELLCFFNDHPKNTKVQFMSKIFVGLPFNFEKNEMRCFLQGGIDIKTCQ